MKVAVIGSFIVDLMARTPHLPEPGETVKGSLFKLGPGGKGFNQAIAANRAGCELVFSTKLGNDSFAKIAQETMLQENINQRYVFNTDTHPTGAALITVDENTSQNEIVVILGACDTFDDADIVKLEPALEGCEYLLLQLEINVDAMEKLVSLAHKMGVKVILNPAPVSEFDPDIYKKLFLVTPNEVEAKTLTGIAYTCDSDCEKIAQSFFALGVKNVILTLGKRGVYINDGVKGQFIDNFEMKVVDTTGAGDAFNGGLLAGLGNGMSLLDATNYGNIVSNLAVTKMGTSCAMPSKIEIEVFISKNKNI